MFSLNQGKLEAKAEAEGRGEEGGREGFMHPVVQVNPLLGMRSVGSASH